MIRLVISFFWIFASNVSLSSALPTTTTTTTTTSTPLPSRQPTATTKNGAYIGLYNPQYGQDFFLGIPYAQPPTPKNNLRFRPPKPLHSTWTTPRPAQSWPPFCPRYGEDSIGREQDEDCLYLNIIRPSSLFPQNGNESNSTNTTSPTPPLLPVAIYIHGGGLFMGGSSDQRFNTSFLLSTASSLKLNKPFIAVTIQYRLSAWGFLGGRQVLGEGVANLGYRDQRRALEWVGENVGAFGGDNKRVAIWGESAGAQSVSAQLLAYNGRNDNLFHRAILQSGSPTTSFFPVLLPGGYNSTIPQSTYNQLVLSTSCAPLLSLSSNITTYNTTLNHNNATRINTNTDKSLECLRNLPFEELNNVLKGEEGSVYGMQPFVPIIDGDFVAAWPSVQLARGDFVKVPLLIGGTADEGTAFGSSYNVSTDEQFLALLSEMGIPSSDQAVLKYLYPNIEALGIPSPATYPLLISDYPSFAAQIGSQYRRITALSGDIIIHAPRRLLTSTLSRLAPNVPIYTYTFSIHPPLTAPLLGSTHFSDVAFVFQNLLGVGYSANKLPFAFLNPEDMLKYSRVAESMGRAWVSFIVDGDPNGASVEGVSENIVGWRLDNANGIPGGWPKYDVRSGGGEGLNVVWSVNASGNASGWVEWDIWRGEGIAFLGERSLRGFGV